MIAAARLVSSACALLVAIASARQLGPVGRGEIVFVITVCVLGSELVSLGTNVSGRVKILQNAGVLIEDFLGLAIVLVAVQATLVGGVLVVVGSQWFELDATVCAAGVGAGAAMFFAHMMLDASFAVRRTLETGVRDLLIGILPVVGVLIAVSVGRLSVSIVIVVTALGYISGGGYLWGVVRRRAGPIRFTPSRWGPILRSGMPVLVGSFGQVVAFRADRLVLGLLSTSAALGVYSVAATAAELQPEETSLTCIAVHGQTVHHAPPTTWQLLDPAPIVAATCVPVVTGQRLGDLACAIDRHTTEIPVLPQTREGGAVHNKKSKYLGRNFGFVTALQSIGFTG